MKLQLTSSSSWGAFAIGCGSWSRQRGGIAGDIMGCWKTVVTVVEEQREGGGMDETSITVPLTPPRVAWLPKRKSLALLFWSLDVWVIGNVGSILWTTQIRLLWQQFIWRIVIKWCLAYCCIDGEHKIPRAIQWEPASERAVDCRAYLSPILHHCPHFLTWSGWRLCCPHHQLIKAKDEQSKRKNITDWPIQCICVHVL